MDLILALIAFPVLLLVCIVFGPMIWLEDRGHIFYLAKRRGLNGSTFNMYKLRSMKVNAPDIRNTDNSTFNSADDSRVTQVGKFLRKTSIDELPQVLNILKGDMSWIGPRASIPKEGYGWDDLEPQKQKRLTVKPGITGYTQALFRNSISADEKLEKDCYYVENASFILDIKIFFWTLKAVFLGKNVYRN